MSAGRLAGGPARLALVAAALAVLVAAGELPGAARGAAAGAAPRPGAEPAHSTVCPTGPVSAGVGGTGALALRTGATRAALRRTAPDRAGAVARVSGPPGRAAADPLVLSASGAAAGGLAAEHVRRLDDGPRRGLLAVRCSAPAATRWFVGGATTAGSTTELVLQETDGAAASVEVRAWSASGPLDPRPGRAVPVPAGGRTVLPLDRVGPDRDLLALQVTTRSGRVSATLQHTRADGRTPQGAAVVPPTAAPAREVVVPGLPAGPGRRAVVLSNPGARALHVGLALTTADGELPQVEITVPAATSVQVDVSSPLSHSAAAARIRSPQGPVLAAGLVVDGPAGGVQDHAWVGAGSVLRTPALLPDVAPGEQLLLSALEADAVVELVPVPVVGPAPLVGPAPAATSRRRVEVAGGTTRAVPLTGPVDVRPVTGAVHAGRVRRAQDSTGPWTATLPVTGAPQSTPPPRVVADALAAWDRPPGS